jgi:hypothetical protein
VSVRRTLAVAAITTALTSGAPIVLPRVITSTWGRSALALHLTIQGWGGLLAFADLGLQTFLVQQVVSKIAEGRVPYAKGMMRTAWRIYGATVGSLAVLVLGAVFSRSEWDGAVVSSAGDLPLLRGAIALHVLTIAATTALGSLSTTAELAVGRDRAPLWFSTVQSIQQVAVIAVAAAMRAPVLESFVTSSIVSFMFVGARAVLSGRLFLASHGRAETEAIPARTLMAGMTASFGIVAGQLLQASVAPLVLTTRNAAAATVAVPWRTLGNVANRLPATLGNALWPRLARAGTAESKVQQRLLVHRLVHGLAGLQLAAATGVALVGDKVFAFWLPKLAHEGSDLLPLVTAEQALLALVLPLNIALFAAGAFRGLALAQLGTGAAMTAMLLVAPTISTPALALASTAALLSVQLPLMLRAANRAGLGRMLVAPPLLAGVVLSAVLSALNAPKFSVVALFSLLTIGFLRSAATRGFTASAANET